MNKDVFRQKNKIKYKICWTRSQKNLQQFSLLSSSPRAWTSALTPDTMASISSSLKSSRISPRGKRHSQFDKLYCMYSKRFQRLSLHIYIYEDNSLAIVTQGGFSQTQLKHYIFNGVLFWPDASKSLIMTRNRSSGICVSVRSKATRWFFTPVFRNKPARSI